MHFWQAGQILLLNYQNWSEKSQQQMQIVLKDTLFKIFHWRGRKQLESPADFFSTVSRNFSARFSDKITNWNFCKEKKISPQNLFWKWEFSFDKDAEIFPTKPRETFGQGPKKIRRITLLKKVQKISFGPAIFVFDKPVEFFPTRFRKKFVCCPKTLEKCMFWKTFSLSLNCSHGHVECSFNKPAKKIGKRPKISAQCRRMIKNFICFPKQLFLNKPFNRYGECSFERPAKLFPPNCRNCSEKIPQKIQKVFQNFFP